jgi:hypothetical protein
MTPTRLSSLTRVLMPVVARAGGSTAPVNPVVDIEPGAGGENTQVTVRGSGLAGNSEARIYLTEAAHANSPGEGRHLYIEINSDADGAYSAEFTVPPAWPDGSALSPGELFFVITDAEQTVLATAPFVFLSNASPATPAPTPTSVAAAPGNLVIEVDIRIEPERINLRGNGVVRVTVQAQDRAQGDDDNDDDDENDDRRAPSSEAFDLAMIEASSVHFGRRSDIIQGTGGASLIKDEVRKRGRRFHFRAQETGLSAEDDEACLQGVWFDHQGNASTFFGCDSIRTRRDRE